MAAKKRKRKGAPANSRLGVEDWLRAARDELIENGILAVKVDRLARRLKVTRGSFYWHFDSHADLLGKLLESWQATNTAPFEKVLQLDKSGLEKFQAIVDLWLSEEEYNPKFDAAVREWARVFPEIAKIVLQADEVRISVLHEIFRQLGYRGKHALVRARITYFHQVGYYTLGISESSVDRNKLLPYYTEALLGTIPN
jgi:AcrR family transcriptional regulator